MYYHFYILPTFRSLRNAVEALRSYMNMNNYLYKEKKPFCIYICAFLVVYHNIPRIKMPDNPGNQPRLSHEGRLFFNVPSTYIYVHIEDQTTLVLLSKEKISSSDNKPEFNPLTNVNCQSSNLIYLITCKHCGIHYVGQTKNRLLTRFQGHYHDIKTKNDTTVSRHFNKCPNGKPSLFDGIRISILSFMHHPSDTTSSQRERDTEEKRWMQRLSSIVPKGLNLMD